MDKVIMSRGRLEDIVARLFCYHSLLEVIRWDMEGKDKIHEEALFSVSDLMNTICQDFQKEIDTAKVYNETAVTV